MKALITHQHCLKIETQRKNYESLNILFIQFIKVLITIFIKKTNNKFRKKIDL